jgi:hypothetical protein
MTNWQLIENSPSIIQVTLPGYEKYLTKVFDKHKVNVFNSSLLEINCLPECGETENLPLPDGIYKIKVIGSPSTYNKEYHYLKTDALQLEIDKLFIGVEKHTKDLMDLVTKIEFLIKGAESHLRTGLINIAGELFQTAIKVTEQAKNCKTCK